MHTLVYMDISLILGKLLPVLKSHEEVVGAYIFGSILGQCRPDSDIDVGILLAPGVSYSEKEAEKIQASMLDDLPPLNNHSFDIIILNQASAIFAFKVISQGRLVYETDHEAVTDFMELTSRRRAENYPRYRQALALICEGVQE